MFHLAVTPDDLGRRDPVGVVARRFIAAAPRPAFDREAAMLAPLLERR